MFRALAAALALAAAGPSAATDTLTNVYPFCGQFKSDQFDLYGAGYRAHVCEFKTFPLGAVVETDIGKYPTLRDRLNANAAKMKDRCINHPDASKQGRAEVSSLFEPVTSKNAAGETVVKWYKVVPCHRMVVALQAITVEVSPADAKLHYKGPGVTVKAKASFNNGGSRYLTFDDGLAWSLTTQVSTSTWSKTSAPNSPWFSLAGSGDAFEITDIFSEADYRVWLTAAAQGVASSPVELFDSDDCFFNYYGNIKESILPHCVECGGKALAGGVCLTFPFRPSDNKACGAGGVLGSINRCAECRAKSTACQCDKDAHSETRFDGFGDQPCGCACVMN